MKAAWVRALGEVLHEEGGRSGWLAGLGCLAQFGPVPGPQGQGSLQSQMYQNPALGMRFPVPTGFQRMQEMPMRGMVAVFLHPMGAELYAASRPFEGDLQAFHQQNLQRLAQVDAQLRAQARRFPTLPRRPTPASATP